MTHRYGIDTSVFVRLLTGDPEADYQNTVLSLERRMQNEPKTEFFVSNQVIGEAYIALQHHYKITKEESRQALHSVLTSGLCSPLNGSPVLDAILSKKGCGLVDRLIVNDYAIQGVRTLTNDAKMTRLPGTEKL
jgi:predicted nucleic acid-binding protein